MLVCNHGRLWVPHKDHHSRPLTEKDKGKEKEVKEGESITYLSWQKKGDQPGTNQCNQGAKCLYVKRSLCGHRRTAVPLELTLHTAAASLEDVGIHVHPGLGQELVPCQVRVV